MCLETSTPLSTRFLTQCFFCNSSQATRILGNLSVLDNRAPPGLFHMHLHSFLGVGKSIPIGFIVLCPCPLALVGLSHRETLAGDWRVQQKEAGHFLPWLSAVWFLYRKFPCGVKLISFISPSLWDSVTTSLFCPLSLVVLLELHHPFFLPITLTSYF